MGKQDKTERGKTQLARLRKARGLTQTEIAYDLGVSKATYSSWESGRIELGAGRITALAERLCCTPNDILGFASTPSMTSPPVTNPHRGGASRHQTVPFLPAQYPPQHPRHHANHRERLADWINLAILRCKITCQHGRCSSFYLRFRYFSMV